MGSLIGGGMSAAGQVAGAKIQADAYTKARHEAMDQAKEIAPTITAAGNDANKLLNPYANMGNNAVNQLTNGLTPQFLQNTPGYQWALQQGQQAATNSAAARGLANSGAALKGASQYATGLADQTYQNQFNDTNTLANYGLNANNIQGNNLLTAATNAGNIRNAAATGSMAAIANSGNAIGQGISGASNALGDGISGFLNSGNTNKNAQKGS